MVFFAERRRQLAKYHRNTPSLSTNKVQLFWCFKSHLIFYAKPILGERCNADLCST